MLGLVQADWRQGAASGIGFSITRVRNGWAAELPLTSAQAFLAAGAVGVTMVDLTQHALETAYADLSASEHARVLLFPGDVSKEATAAGYTEATIRKWGQVDVSVQCAGIPMSRKPLLEVELDVFDKVMAVNVRGVFMGMKQSIAAMVASPSGGKGCSVIIISSQLGLEGGFVWWRLLMARIAGLLGLLGVQVRRARPHVRRGAGVRPAGDTRERHLSRA